MAEHADIQRVLDLYAAFGRDDASAIFGLLDEQVEWHLHGPRDQVPYAGVWRGHRGIAEMLVVLAATIDVLSFEVRETMAFDSRVLVLGHERVRVRATGRIFETAWVQLFTLQAGRVVHIQEFYDTATMATAFRLA